MASSLVHRDICHLIILVIAHCMARGEEEPQELEEETEEKESESLIGDDDDLFGDDAAAVPEVEELDKNGRYADEDEDEDEDEEDDDGVDFDEM